MRRVAVLAVVIVAIVVSLAAPRAGERVLLGWAQFVARVVPRMAVSADGMATAIVCLALLAVGGHLFFSWLLREVARGRAASAVAAPRWKARCTATLLALILLMFTAGVAATGVVHQVGWLARPRVSTYSLVIEPGNYSTGDPASRLKHLGLAIHGVTMMNDDRLPTGYANAAGRKLHSWQTETLMALSYVMGGDWDQARAWDDPQNSAYFRAIVLPYLNPRIGVLRDERGYALSHFAGNVHVLGGRAPRRIADFAGRTSETIVAGEVATRFKAWGNPSNLRDPLLGINTASEGFGGPAGNGANLVFLDGSVRFLRRTADPAVMRRLSGADAQ